MSTSAKLMVILIAEVVNYIVITLAYLVVSWSLDLPFTVKYSVGVFVIVRTLIELFKKARPKTKDE